MHQLAAHASIVLETTLVRGDIQRINFEIVDASGELVVRSDDLALQVGRARWKWTPNGEHGQALPDELDERIVEARVVVRHAGRVRQESLGRIRVFRDRVVLRVVDETGAALEGVRVRPILDDAASRHIAFVRTDAAGQAEFSSLPPWTSMAVRVATPWAIVDPRRPWVSGKHRGRVRELVVEPKRYDAGLLELRSDEAAPFWPVPEGDHERHQVVNCGRFSGGEDVPGKGEDPSNFGHTLQLRVGARTRAAELVGERVFIELRADPGNAADSKPRPGLRGADEHGVLALELGEQGAVCQLELGCRAGDRFTLSISDTGKFGDAADQRVEFVNWHRYYYELCHPAAMAPALEPAALASAIERELDPDHVGFRLAHTQVIPDATARASGRLVNAGFFARSDARELYLGSSTSPALARGFVREGKQRTVFIELLDLAFAPGAVQVCHVVELRAATLELGPCDGERCFVPDARGLGVTPPPNSATVELVGATRARLSLPRDTPTPARVQLNLVELTPGEPSGEQLLFDRDPEQLAARMCGRLRDLMENRNSP